MPFIVKRIKKAVNIPFITLYEMMDSVETIMGNKIPTFN